MIHDKNFFGMLDYVVNCDECGDEETIDAESFAECVERIKDMGWKIRHDGNEWVHYCLSCKERI